MASTSQTITDGIADIDAFSDFMTGAASDDVFNSDGDNIRTLAYYLGATGAVITPAMHGGDADAAARAAYVAGVPLRLDQGVARLVIDPTAEALSDSDEARGAVIESALRWAQICEVGDAELAVVIAAGVHRVQLGITLEGRSPVLLWGETGPAMIAVTGADLVSYASNVIEWQVSLAAALPAHVEIGSAVGGWDIYGESAAPSLNGAHKVTWIASDRMSYRCRVPYRSSRTVSAPSSVTASGVPMPDAGAKIMVMPCELRLTGGWLGHSDEGAISGDNGSHFDTRWIAWNYDAPATSENDSQELLFIGGHGQLRTTGYTIFCDCSDHMIRAFMGSIDLNLVMAGGLAPVATVYLQAVRGRIIRSCIAGGSIACVQLGLMTSLQIAYCIFTGGAAGVKTAEIGDQVKIDSTLIFGAAQGVYAVIGQVRLGAGVRFERCTRAIYWLNGGRVLGSFAAVDCQIDLPAEPGEYFSGGYYLEVLSDLPTRPAAGGEDVYLANAKRWRIALDGGGYLRLVPHLVAETYVELYLRSDGAVFSAVAESVGPEVVFAAAPVADGANAGKVTVSAYADAETGKAIVEIYNNDAGTRSWNVELAGNLSVISSAVVV